MLLVELLCRSASHHHPAHQYLRLAGCRCGFSTWNGSHPTSRTLL